MPAIRVRGVCKDYSIYRRPEDRLKQMIVPRLNRLFGRPPVAYYTSYAAIRDISFDVEKGETIGLIGRNGSGKSTLLSILHGTLEPTRGSVEREGKPYGLRLGEGFDAEFTGRENVIQNGLIMGLSRRELIDRMPSIIEFAGIGHFIDQPMKTYSSGMYSRLAFAVATQVDTDILLVDEVLAVGDIAFSQKCMRFIRTFKSKGTLVICSHDMGSIRQLCDRVLWMDAGELRLIGPPKEVCDEYQRAVQLQNDGTAEMKFGGRRHNTSPSTEPKRQPDHRKPIIEGAGLDGKIELFDFDHEAAWYGQRLATIASLGIAAEDGTKLHSLKGGEEVAVIIKAAVHAPLDSPILGFSVRNKKGQTIFADNTHITYRDTPMKAKPGTTLVAEFRFNFPYLPTGDYTINCAIAEGSQTDHVQQHWIDDAVAFHVASSYVAKGLVGIPMHSITLAVEKD